jgi:hypothetical protein
VSRPAEVDAAGRDVIGAGARAYPDVFGPVDDALMYPNAENVARLSLTDAAMPVSPLYLRRPDAVAPGPRKPVRA